MATKPRAARSAAAIATLSLTALGAFILPAYSVWSDSKTSSTVSFPVGTVAFGVATLGTQTTDADDNNIVANDTLQSGGTQVIRQFKMSAAGAPVTIAIPGTVIGQVLNASLQSFVCPNAGDPTNCDESPFSPVVLWEFVVDARSPQSVGVEYALSALGQVNTAADDGVTITPTDTERALAWDGKGNSNTLLAYSTLEVYPADSTNDCSNVPPLPTDVFGTRENPIAGAPNVYLYSDTYEGLADPSTDNGDGTEDVATDDVNTEDGDAAATSAPAPGSAAALGLNPASTAVLLGTATDGTGNQLISQPGVLDNGPVEQTWCVAIQFINIPDQPYTQEAWASGNGYSNLAQAADTNVYTAYQSWGSLIATPPTLPMLGYYINNFTGTGVGLDGTTASNSAGWWAEIYPDPSNEPDVLLSLDPTVIHIVPTYNQPSDTHPSPSNYYSE